MEAITVPYDWVPRDYQLPGWLAMQDDFKRASFCWHRRAGKDLFAINFIASQVPQRVGLYWHVLPTYRQGRKVVWEGRTREGRAFLDHFPGHDRAGEPGSFVTRKRDDEMKLWFANGSQYQVVGADNPDMLVGSNPIGIVFSEYAVFQSSMIWNLLRPILAENGGFAIFITTPRGRNHFYKLHKMAEENPKWFAQRMGYRQSGAISEEDVQAERDAGMPENLVEQEFEVSFEAALVGSFYGDLMANALNEKRITSVPYEPSVPVNTFWDIGIRDATAIWFHQQVGFQHRFIDFYYATDVGVDHYVNLLRSKPYTWGRHLMPPDIMVRELGTVGGRTRFDTLRKLGVQPVVAPKTPLADGINAVRQFLPKSWFDEEKCETGLEGLRQYIRKTIDGEEDPNGQPLYSDTPAHNWASHPADAMRTGCVTLNEVRVGEPERRSNNPDLGLV